MIITELKNKSLDESVSFIYPFTFLHQDNKNRLVYETILQVQDETEGHYFYVRSDDDCDYWPLIESITIVED